MVNKSGIHSILVLTFGNADMVPWMLPLAGAKDMSKVIESY